MPADLLKSSVDASSNIPEQTEAENQRLTDRDTKNEDNEPEKLLYVQQAQEFFHEPIENENTVFALIASGDVDKILENKLKYSADPDNGKGQLSDDPLRNQIYHFVVCAAVVARTCLAAGMSEETAYTLSDVYIRRADKCTSVKQVMELNDEMVMDYAVRMRRLRRAKRLSVPVRKAIKMISENTGKRLTVQQIADATGYDRSHLHRLFKAEIGIGIHEYISAVRMNAAKGMLKDGTHSIADIASLLGFSSQSHFCRAFSEAVGVTPKEFRDGKLP
ncbi:MAG: helix-turn-helix transcriptional regulator [Ruminiclostridium sp.]